MCDYACRRWLAQHRRLVLEEARAASRGGGAGRGAQRHGCSTEAAAVAGRAGSHQVLFRHGSSRCQDSPYSSSVLKASDSAYSCRNGCCQRVPGETGKHIVLPSPLLLHEWLPLQNAEYLPAQTC